MKNGWRRRVLQAMFAIAVGIGSLCAPPATFAQSDNEHASGRIGGGGSDVRVAEELAGLRSSVERLVQLMESQLAQRDVEILLRRIEMKERRLAPMESRVSDLKAELRQAELEETNFKEYVEQVEASLSEARRASNPEEIRGHEQELEGLERVMKIQAARAEDLDRQIIELENLLSGSRKEVKDLDDRLNELLEQ